MSNAIQSLWQDQEPPLREMTTDDFRQRAEHALSLDRRYKAAGLISAGILMACFGLMFSASESTLSRFGCAIGIAAGISIAYRANRLMVTHPLLVSTAGIDAYRRILQREQHALAICWQTMLMVQAGVVLELLGHPRPGARTMVTCLATVAPVVAIALFTRAKARAYARRAQELSRS